SPRPSPHSEKEWGEGGDRKGVGASLILASSRRQGIEHALVLELDRPRHQDVVVGAPLDDERSTRQRHRYAALREPLAHGAHGRGARSAAASLGEAGATLPGANRDGIAG